MSVEPGRLRGATGPEPVDWPGAVVVGGGATGLLTALELDRRGLAALVVEETALCSGQTGQCHGWLHHGAVFTDAEPDEFDLLDRGARQWERLAGGLDGGLAVPCYLAGRHQFTRDAIAAIWDRLRLRYENADTTGEAYGWRLRGPENAVVPIEVLRAALATSGVVIRRAQAVELQVRGDVGRATALVVHAGPHVASVQAAAFVLATGAGMGGLLPGSDVPARLTRRLSFMLVVRSDSIGGCGLAVPEQEALGLFAVPRAKDGKRYLLLSNFVSYIPSTDISAARANWLAGIGPTVARYLPRIWSAPDALWGLYSAVKVEPVRDLALGVAGPAEIPTGFTNVWAGVPGKLVLAPILAERLANHVAEYLADRCPQPRHPPAAALPPVPWGPEEWQLTPLVRCATMFGEDANR
jgi:glycine/D-amino acid oxidase-like deaminating enzyme